MPRHGSPLGVASISCVCGSAACRLVGAAVVAPHALHERQHLRRGEHDEVHVDLGPLGEAPHVDAIVVVAPADGRVGGDKAHPRRRDGLRRRVRALLHRRPVVHASLGRGAPRHTGRGVRGAAGEPVANALPRLGVATVEGRARTDAAKAIRQRLVRRAIAARHDRRERALRRERVQRGR